MKQMLSHFRGNDHTRSAIHDYIHRVLEKSDHGRNRVLTCGAKTLDHALEKHAEQLAEKIRPEFEKRKDHVGPPPPDKKTKVHNYGGNVSFECYVHAPKTMSDIIDLFVQARHANLKIRAVGAFHSWSPICVTDGFLIQTTHLTGTKPTDTTYLKDPAAATIYYDVLSGTPMKDVARELEKYGRGLRNMGGCSDLHMVGISCTGAHGSGITVPPLADMIKGVTLVSANFGSNSLPIVYRIEPTNGITDPKKLIPNVTLVQDDATLNAIAVGLGAFGVVYSVTIETVPFYWIKETREIIEWPAVKKKLQQGLNGDILKYHANEVLMNAYTSRALVTKRELVTEPPAHVTNPESNAFVTLIQAIPAFEKIWKHISKQDGLIVDIHRELGNVIAALLKHLPLLVPAMINIALETQNHDEPVIGKYYDLYNIGFVSRFPVICCELTYPMNTYIAGVEAALNAVQKSRQKDISRAVSGFLSLRFSSASSATISMAHSDDPSPAGARSYLEIYSLTEFYEDLQTFDDIVRPIQEQAVSSFLARHHWGQYVTPKFKAEEYKKKDPKFAANIAAVRKIADKYDPKHMMTNKFLEEVVFTT